MFTVKASTYQDGQNMSSTCAPYHNGFVKLDMPESAADLAELYDFFLLPEDKDKFAQMRKDYPNYAYFYVYGHVHDPAHPLLALLPFAPAEFLIGHSIAAKLAMDRLDTDFHIVMSGVLLTEGDKIVYNDHSGHYDEYIHSPLRERYGDEWNVAEYARKYVTPGLERLLSAPVGFCPFCDSVFDFTSAHELVHQRYRRKVCGSGRDFSVYPNNKSCKSALRGEKSDPPVTTYCSDADVNALVSAYKRDKLAKYGPKVRGLVERLKAGEDLSAPELMLLQKELLGKATPIMPAYRGFIIKQILAEV